MLYLEPTTEACTKPALEPSPCCSGCVKKQEHSGQVRDWMYIGCTFRMGGSQLT